MIVRRLRRDYSAAELDEGEGMTFHPVTGIPFAGSGYWYSDEYREYYIRSGWAGLGNLPQGRIGDGQLRSAGDPYPPHWLFDPFTGKKL